MSALSDLKLEVDDDWVRGTLRLTASGVSYVPLEGGQPRQIPIGTLLRVVTHDRRRRWKKARPCVELWAATGTKATFDCRDDRRRKAFACAAEKARHVTPRSSRPRPSRSSLPTQAMRFALR